MECELLDFLDTEHVSGIVGKIVNVKAEEDVLSENVNVKEVRIDYRKAAMFKETIQVFTQQQENIFKVKYIKPDGEVAALVEMILQKQEEK